jgi:hypothetical protein
LFHLSFAYKKINQNKLRKKMSVGQVLTNEGTGWTTWTTPSSGGGSVGPANELNVSNGTGGWSDAGIQVVSQSITATPQIFIGESTQLNGCFADNTHAAIVHNSTGNSVSCNVSGTTVAANLGTVVLNASAGSQGIQLTSASTNPTPVRIDDSRWDNHLTFANSGADLNSGGNIVHADSAEVRMSYVPNNNRLAANSTGVHIIANSLFLTVNGAVYTWPSTQGAAGTTLRNDGAGNLTWAV